MKTRFDEVTFPTSDINEMAGRFLATDVKRSWNDDFLDESTGEVVSIERTEMVMRRGTLLTPDELSSLSFFLQAGEVQSVMVTNVKRPGVSIEMDRNTIWAVSVSGGDSKRKRKYILFAQSLDQAIIISKDYLEQTMEGSFKIEAAKSFNNCIILQDDNLSKMAKDADGNIITEKKEGEAPGFYTIQTSVKTSGGITRYYTWLLTATSVDDAKVRIHKYIDQEVQEQVISGKTNDEQWADFEITVLSGEQTRIDSVIPREFSMAYFQQADEEAVVADPDKMFKQLDKLWDESIKNKQK